MWPRRHQRHVQGMRRVRQPLGALNHFTATAGHKSRGPTSYPRTCTGICSLPARRAPGIRRARSSRPLGSRSSETSIPDGVRPRHRSVVPARQPEAGARRRDLYRRHVSTASSRKRSGRRAGSTLPPRTNIEQYQLDGITDHGHIWRLRFNGRAAIPLSEAIRRSQASPASAAGLTQPRMLDETALQLVLSSRSIRMDGGATRLSDCWSMKQPQSVVPALQKLAATASSITRDYRACEFASKACARWMRRSIRDR